MASGSATGAVLTSALAVGFGVLSFLYLLAGVAFLADFLLSLAGVAFLAGVLDLPF